MSNSNLQKAALIWYDAGCSVWPPTQDGTKRPMGEWKRFMRERAPRDMIEQFYSKQGYDGVGIVCGKISGNLEMLELEGRAVGSESLDKILAETDKREITWLLSALMYDGYSEWTPSGGIHMIYRVVDHPVPGSTKVARRPATAEELAESPDANVKTLSETRGEGGYVIVAPSGGGVHPTGESWETYNGRWGRISEVTWADRCKLLEAVEAALDELPQEPEFVRPNATRQLPTDSTRPGDDFSSRVQWEEILEPRGWRVHHRTLRETFWTRPGKKRRDGWSATTGYSGSGLDDRLYVWSSSTEFQTEKPYNKFGAYTLLEHGGDFAAAARALGAKGYGTQRPHVVASNPVTTTFDPRSVVPVPVPTQTEPSQATPPAASSAPVTGARTAAGLPVYDASAMDDMSWDGISIANKWIELHGDTFAYIPADKTWMMWSGNRWEPDSRARHEYSATQMAQTMLVKAKMVEQENPDVGKILVKEAKKLMHNTQIQSLLRNARCDPRMTATPDDFDKDQNLLTVGNGVFNLSTMTMSAHDPSMLLTRRVNANYNPSAPKGRWERFMQEVLPDQQVRDYVQRVCGYMIGGSMNERVMMLLYGESGTGKTQFLEALSEVLGDFSGVAPASAFQPRQAGYKGPSEDLHKLRGKRFVMQSELDSNSRLNEALVKSIVGADTQTTRPLYGSPVDWKPEYTVFLATNHLPLISSSENAIWNRVKPINFAQVFIDEKGQALDPNERGIGRRMASQEADSILNWLLEGLAEYRRIGLAEPEQIGTWLNQYREDVDTCRQFLTQAPEDGMISIGTQERSTVTDLYRKYVEWGKSNGTPLLGMRKFNARMESAGFKRKRQGKGVVWFGVGISAGQWLVGDTVRSESLWSKRE